MKQFAILILFVFVASSGFAQQEYRENPVKYKGESEDKTYFLYNNKEYPSSHIKINFFYPESYRDKFILEKVQSVFIGDFFGEEYRIYDPEGALKVYVIDRFAAYKKMLEDSGLFLEEKQTAEEKGERIEEYKSLYINEEVIRNTVLFNKENIISQVVNKYMYTGGAHGLSYSIGTVIDLDTGNKVRYEDVFEEETEDIIAVMILNKLKHRYSARSVDDLGSIGFVFDKIIPSPNFVADDKGITFIYGQYELGAYILGIIEVQIPYHQLDKYIKQTSPLRRIMGV